jgi:hypothetical protein
MPFAKGAKVTPTYFGAISGALGKMIVDDFRIQETIEKLFRLYGGKEEFRKDAQKQLDDFNERWNQNSDMLGRILRSHLVVEHYLTLWIQHQNKNLGSISDAKLSFSNKIALVGKSDLSVIDLVPGLKRLNKIRNRIAHNLSVEILKEDEEALKSSKYFKAMIRLNSGLYCSPTATGIELLEGFAKYSAGTLQAGSHENEHLWREAFGSGPNAT